MPSQKPCFRLAVAIFADHPGQSGEDVKDTSGKKKKGSGKTVSSFYKDQLNNLMTTLHATEPHFIRYPYRKDTEPLYHYFMYSLFLLIFYNLTIELLGI